jgi:hypothetical protein
VREEWRRGLLHANFQVPRCCLRGVGLLNRLRGLFHRRLPRRAPILLLLFRCLSLLAGAEQEGGLVETEVDEVVEVCGQCVVGVGEGTEVGTVVALLAEEGREEEVLGGRRELIHNNC